MAAEHGGDLPEVSEAELEAEVAAEEAEAAERDARLEIAEREAEAEEAAEAGEPDAQPEPTEAEWGMEFSAEDVAEPGFGLAMATEPTIDWSVFERGPLAAGIQILEAMLEEAKSGYIAAQIETLERVLEENFSWDDRAVLTQAASQLRSASNLPDIAAAYREMVAQRAQREPV